MSTIWTKAKEKENYSGIGDLNKSAFPQQFVDICKMPQRELKNYLLRELTKYYQLGRIARGDGYIYVRGTEPVALTAHMDTVHAEPVKDFYGFARKDGTHVISSPQGIGGDDRCGIYMILDILQRTELRPYIIFCEDEEIGGVGSRKFTKEKVFQELEAVKFFVELDRANANDLVFYEDANEEFHAWCEEITGFKENGGSFSDISHFCPEIETSGVNISCGYYNAHTKDEFVVLEEMNNATEATIKLIEAAQDKDIGRFIYKSCWADRYYDYESYEYGYPRSFKGYGGDKDPARVTMYFVFEDPYTGAENDAIVDGESYYSCIAQFLLEHGDICWNDVLDHEVL